jgi:hypothetical protein
MNKQPKIERRYNTVEIRADEDGKNIVGYACKYGVRSDDMGGWREVIAPTAFDAHLATAPDVVALFNHNPDAILGRTSAGTLKVNSDSIGVNYVINSPDTTAGRDLVTSIKRGDIKGASFGFRCQDASWDRDEVAGIDVRTVKKAELVDCSPVTFPAYPQATSGLRSLPADMPTEVRSRISARATEPECGCDCEQCGAGSCGICSNEDCDDDSCFSAGCTQQDRSANPGETHGIDKDDDRSWRELMELRIAVAIAVAKRL